MSGAGISSSSNNNEAPVRTKVRPESTMALNFSAALDSVFNLGGELDGLSQDVEERKRSVNDQSKELEELEARLKAAEERLTKAGYSPPAGSGQQERVLNAANNKTNMSPAPPSRAAPIPGQTASKAAHDARNAREA